MLGGQQCIAGVSQRQWRNYDRRVEAIAPGRLAQGGGRLEQTIGLIFFALQLNFEKLQK